MSEETKEKKKSGSLKRFFTKAAIGLSLLGLAGGSYWYAFDKPYSEGERVGEPNKLSKKGVLFKTWEGTLNITDYEKWDYSVKDDEVVKAIQDAAEVPDARVKMYYEETLLHWPWEQKTDYEVVGIKILNQKAKETETVQPETAPDDNTAVEAVKRETVTQSPQVLSGPK
jgi:hypothetical protein